LRPELAEAREHIRLALEAINRLESIDNPPFEPTEPDASFLTPPPMRRGDTILTTAWWDAAFKRWYAVYWNHTAPQNARKAFEKRVKSMKQTPASAVEALIKLAELDRRKFECTENWSWRKNMLPSTWLNQERWTDEGPKDNAGGQEPVQYFKAEWEK
jgi:hypothetical protein